MIVPSIETLNILLSLIFAVEGCVGDVDCVSDIVCVVDGEYGGDGIGYVGGVGGHASAVGSAVGASNPMCYHIFYIILLFIECKIEHNYTCYYWIGFRWCFQCQN